MLWAYADYNRHQQLLSTVHTGWSVVRREASCVVMRCVAFLCERAHE